VGVAWQVMTRATAQAGNRASRTEHYLQWWAHSPEWTRVDPCFAETARLQFCAVFRFGLWCCPVVAAVVICVRISGLVVEYIVAIDVTRVRFPADAFVDWWRGMSSKGLALL
jgi:hypothetical protein